MQKYPVWGYIDKTSNLLRNRLATVHGVPENGRFGKKLRQVKDTQMGAQRTMERMCEVNTELVLHSRVKPQPQQGQRHGRLTRQLVKRATDRRWRWAKQAYRRSNQLPVRSRKLGITAFAKRYPPVLADLYGIPDLTESCGKRF